MKKKQLFLKKKIQYLSYMDLFYITSPFRLVIFKDFRRYLLFLVSIDWSIFLLGWFRLSSLSLSSSDFFVIWNIRYGPSSKNDDFFRIIFGLFYRYTKISHRLHKIFLPHLAYSLDLFYGIVNEKEQKIRMKRK